MALRIGEQSCPQHDLNVPSHHWLRRGNTVACSLGPGEPVTFGYHRTDSEVKIQEAVKAELRRRLEEVPKMSVALHLDEVFRLEVVAQTCET